MHEPAIEENEEIVIWKGDRPTVALKAGKISGEQMGGVTSKSKAEFRNISPGKELTHKYDVVVKKVMVVMHDLLLGDENTSQSVARRYYERWRFLKKIGVPVVSTMRVVDDERVLMGNMTADGSEFVGKETYWNGENLDKPLSAMERKFLEIDPSLIKKEVSRMFFKAWINGVVLPDDDEEFTVLVHPNGTWNVMVKDLDWLRSVNDMPEGYLESRRRILFDRIDYIRLILKQRAKLNNGK